jgi:hypothetical protein
VGTALVVLGTMALIAMGMAFGAGNLAIQNASAGFVQSFGMKNTAAGTTLTATPGSATTTGDLLVATIRTRVASGAAATISGVSDSALNPWTKATSVLQGTLNDADIWYAANTSSDTQVTVTVSAAAAIAFTVVEVAGATATPLDRIATSSGSSTTPSVGPTATTSQASEIVVADIGWNTSLTPTGQSSGYTTTLPEQSGVPSVNAGEQAAFQILSATATPSYAAKLSSSVAWTGTIASFVLGTGGPTPTPTLTPTPTPTATPPPGAPHIMLIVEENQSLSGVIGNKTCTGGTLCAPYLTGLAGTYASATNWYGVQHNSPHDYLDLIVGSDLGLPNGQPYSTPTLVDELHSANLPWVSFMESMPSDCTKGGTSNGLYDTNHNPFVHFKNYSSASGGWCSSANLSSEGVLPYPGSSGLVSTLDGASAPDFVFLVPNDCDEMHGDPSSNPGSPCASDTNNQLITAGDTWLSSNLAPVLTSTWFKQNGIVIITWDESIGGDTSGCCGLSAPGGHIATIVVAANNKGLGNFTQTGDHYGTLRAIEDAYGVGKLGGSSNSVNGDLTGAFGTAPTTGSISGTVMDTESPAQPVTGASVTYTGTGGTTGTGTTAANASGAYTFSGVPRGTYSVSVTEPGYTTPLAQNVTVTGGTTATANFVMAANSSISGTVSDTESPAEPVNGATVSYTGTGTSTGRGTIPTSSGGTYTFNGVPPGTYSVSVSDTGFTSPSAQNVTVVANTPLTGVDFTLTANSGISGTVTDSSHNPIPMATITYTGTGSSTGSGSIPTSSGSYSFSGVPPGTFTVSASAPGYSTPAAQKVTVPANGTATANFTLTQVGTISGTVTANGGGGLDGATVTYTGPGGTGTTNTSDTAGEYQLTDVPAGSYSVTASYAGYAPETFTVTVNGNTVTQPFVLTAGTDGSIAGTVIDVQTSQPIAGASVSDGIDPSVLTDGSGNYVIENVAPNTDTVTASMSGYVTGTTSVTVSSSANTQQNFSLAEDGGITGTVTDANTHAAISGAVVTCTCQGTGTTTNTSGDYTFTQIAPGSYTLTVTATGYTARTTAPFAVSAGLTTTENVQLTSTAKPLKEVQTFGIANTAASTTLMATTGTSTGSGDLLVVTVRDRSSALTMITGITDSSGGNTWTKATGIQSGQADEEIWYAANAKSVTSVTITVSGTASLAMTVVDVAGASTSPLDRIATSSGTSTTPSVGPTATTSQANEIVIADIGWNSTDTLGSETVGYNTPPPPPQQSTVSGNQTGEQADWQILSAIGAQSFAGTLSTSHPWTGAIATFE